MSARNGKIARLPRPIRDELNRRLEAAEESPEILPWLNGLPEVQALLQEHFEGAPVTKQNLSHWRQGGFQEALARRDLAQDAHDLTELAGEMSVDGVDVVLADNAATVLAARLGALVAHWNGEADEAFAARAKIFNAIGKTLVQLQRQMHQSRRETAAVKEAAEKREREKKEARNRQTFSRILDSAKAREMAKDFGGGEEGFKKASHLLALLRGDAELPAHRPESPSVQVSQGGLTGAPAEQAGKS